MAKKRSEAKTPPGYTIAHAFSELNPQAFSLWIRLVMVADRDLARGGRHVADLIKLPRRTFDRTIKSLRDFSYVEIDEQKRPGEPSKIILKRRAYITGTNHFVQFGHVVTAKGFANLR